MRPDLANIESLQAFLAGYNLSPNEDKSQNFLVCQEVIEAILLAMEGGPNNVTELGAGVGTMTQALVASNYNVRAIEKDGDLARVLPKALAAKERVNLEVINKDMKEVRWERDEGYQLVGNIPYHMSGWIIRRMTQLKPAPERVVLLTQKEVGERMSLETKDRSLLTLAVELWGRAERLLQVPASCFWPEPKVESQLSLIVPLERVEALYEENERVMAIARPLFQGKRKQIGGQMSKAFGLKRKAVDKILDKVGLKREQRPEELTVEEWRRLTVYMV